MVYVGYPSGLGLCKEEVEEKSGKDQTHVAKWAQPTDLKKDRSDKE